jgi:hypothetical protein
LEISSGLSRYFASGGSLEIRVPIRSVIIGTRHDQIALAQNRINQATPLAALQQIASQLYGSA